MTSAVDGKFTVVQALRGLAALWVVLFHVNAGHYVDGLTNILPDVFNVVIFEHGHYGVPIFFALSGFVIMHSLRNVVYDGQLFARFVFRRSLRLDPPYWLSILVTVVVAALIALLKRRVPDWPGFSSIVSHMFYLQVFLGQPDINVVYWTLAYEVQFYLFLVGVLVLAKRSGSNRLNAVGWAVLTGLAFAAAWSVLPPMPTGLFIPLWPAFFCGVLAYQARQHRGAVIALIVLALEMAVRTPLPDTGFMRVSAVSAIGLYAASITGYLWRGLDQRWLQKLGTISYSLYLLHIPVIWIVGSLGRRLAGEGLGGAIVSLLLIVGASIATAALFWWMVEQPSHRLSQRIRLPRPRPSIAG